MQVLSKTIRPPDDGGAKWPKLQRSNVRTLGLECSASGTEHAWSIEAWIHSAKRNRLGQRNVDRLLRSHANLILENLVQDWELKDTKDVLAKVLPWDIEMIIEEPEDHDEEDDSEAEELD